MLKRRHIGERNLTSKTRRGERWGFKTIQVSGNSKGIRLCPMRLVVGKVFAIMLVCDWGGIVI